MSVEKDPEKGTWTARFRYKDWQGQVHQTCKRGFATKKTAKEYEVNIISTAAERPSITYEKLAELYLDDLKERTSDNTYKAGYNALHYHVIPYVGSMEIKDITPNTVRQWQIKHKIKKDGTTLASSTINTNNQYFSASLTFAVKYYNLASNPFVITGKTGKVNKRKVFLEMDEFDKLLKAEQNPYYKMVYLILFHSGMRVGELMALQPADIDTNHNVINISKSYDYNKKTVGPPKHGSSRRIAMPDFVIKLIDNYLSRQYVMPEMPFAMKSDRALRDAIKRAAAAAGLSDDITTHDLRHSHASVLIHQAIPITDISRRLGHSSPDITLKTYSHFYKDSDKAIAATLEKCAQTVLTVY